MAGPDGTDGHPWVVVSEFEVSMTTTVPVVTIRVDGVASARNNPSQALGVAPMNGGVMEPGLRLRMIDGAGVDHLPLLLNEVGQPRITLTLRNTGTFPVAVWGLPQNKDKKKVPGGDVIAATDGLTLDLHAAILPGLPPVKYDRVETNKRRPLPFVQQQVRADLMSAASALAKIVPDEPVLDVALHVLPKAGNSATAMAALARDRAAPPRLGSLTEGLDDTGTPLGDRAPASPPVVIEVDHRVLAPTAVALLTSPASLPERVSSRTTVGDAASTPRTNAPTLTELHAANDLAVPAVLRRVPLTGTSNQTTMVSTAAAPLTRPGRGPVAAVAARGAQLDGQQRLTALTGALIGSRTNRVRAARAAVGNALAAVLAGEVAVLAFPNARRDAADGERPTLGVTGEARLIQLGHGGAVLGDVARSEKVTVAKGAERLVVVSLGDREADATGDGSRAGTAANSLRWSVGTWRVGARCTVVERSRNHAVAATARRCRLGARCRAGARYDDRHDPFHRCTRRHRHRARPADRHRGGSGTRHDTGRRGADRTDRMAFRCLPR